MTKEIESQMLRNVFNIEVYKISIQLGDLNWKIFSKMSYDQKDTLGKQITRAIDSISANIVEGYGRYFYKDKVRFYYIARASAFEACDWLNKMLRRKIIVENEYNEMIVLINSIIPKINVLIKNTCNQTKK